MIRRIVKRFYSIERIKEETDALIIGAGPAGLSAAIKLKQMSVETGKEVRVIVLEKGGEVGAHTLSGAVIEPSGIEALFPDWKERGAPLFTPAIKDSMKFLTEKYAISIPHPPQMNNKGNYIVSLSEVVKWLGEQAEELGVEIYPGISGNRILYKDGQVRGVGTIDLGIDKNGNQKPTFEPGMDIEAKLTFFAEGCHGSLTKELISKYNLRENSQFQTYGIGLKEVWEIDPQFHNEGHVIHTIGWPLTQDVYGGSFIYHAANNQLFIGYVVGLDYRNTYLNPYKEFQVVFSFTCRDSSIIRMFLKCFKVGDAPRMEQELLMKVVYNQFLNFIFQVACF